MQKPKIHEKITKITQYLPTGTKEFYPTEVEFMEDGFIWNLSITANSLEEAQTFIKNVTAEPEVVHEVFK